MYFDEIKKNFGFGCMRLPMMENSFSYKAKNAPQGCDPCGVEDALACPHGRAKSHKVTLCSHFSSKIDNRML